MENLAKTLGGLLLEKKLFLATAESCTGGLVSAAITSISGSSNWFERGFITYSNESKIALLSVNPETLEKFGAVSEETAKEMASGAIKHSNAQISISVTGIAGPDGGTPEKPVGLVYFAWCIENKIFCESKNFSGNRDTIRTQATTFALSKLIELMTSQKNPH